MLTKIHIQNYRVFENFTLEFTDGLNVIVGDNDTGKSTLLEAVNLALTGRVNGRPLSSELSPHHFNRTAADGYLEGLAVGENPAPPEIVIDLYLEERDDTAVLKGTNNSTVENEPGLRIRVRFAEEFAPEYESFLTDGDVTVVPAEYYRVEWLSFAGNPVTARSVPATASIIDAPSIRLQSGADHYLQQIITEHLDLRQRVEIARAYRSLRETFTGNQAIEAINIQLAAAQQELTDRELSLAIDISPRTSWESNIVPHLDDLPCQYVGRGAQNTLKVLLALNRSAERCHVVLIEEPENHQSPASLNRLIAKIAERCEGKQVLVTTHSSFVLNKLGVDRLVLLGADTGMRLTELPSETLEYFKKLPGYDTMRIALAQRIILVEGPSDELIVQRAFLDTHGTLPLEAGVDVISVRGLSFKRFLDIALPLGTRVDVVIDNDGTPVEEVKERFATYTTSGLIRVHTGDPHDGHTLEPQILASANRDALNALLKTEHSSDEDLINYMEANKTRCALAIFEADTQLSLPQYVHDALAD